MLVLQSPQVIQETTLRWKRQSKIAFVPTMGCLHEGHLRLVEKAKRFGQKTVVSIFVNPLQFGIHEDLEKYPRPFEQDCAMLEELNVDLLVAPSPKDLYPEGFQTRVHVGELSRHLCGGHRPGHFEGVATVCLKLFQITQADVAVFGEKDFQQLRVIQQMTEDLNLPLTIVAEPTVRQTDGLALSSRNRYLSEEQRAAALAIPTALQKGREIAQNPQAQVQDVLSAARQIIERSRLHIEYLTIAPERTLVPAEPKDLITSIVQPRLFVAARVGDTRLIDNQPLVETL